MSKRGNQQRLTEILSKIEPSPSEPKLDLSDKKTPTSPAPAPEATPAPKPVNPAFDAMPDEIEDPGLVFKMAFLDTECAKLGVQIVNQRNEFEQKLSALKLHYQNVLNTLAAQQNSMKQRLKEHKDYIEGKYKIALKSYTFDDETGVLKKILFMEEEQQAK